MAKRLVLMVSLVVSVQWHAALPQSGFKPPSQSHVLQFSQDQIAVAPKVASLNLGATFTMETWVYLNSSPPYGNIMGKPHDPRGQDPYMSYLIEFDSTGQRLEFVQTTGQAGSYRAATAPQTLPVQTWTHVAATLGGGGVREGLR